MRDLHVTSHGYTAETFAIAERLYYGADGARLRVIKLLKSMDEPITYSNQDFDMKQQLASVLADLLREAKGAAFLASK